MAPSEILRGSNVGEHVASGNHEVGIFGEDDHLVPNFGWITCILRTPDLGAHFFQQSRNVSRVTTRKIDYLQAGKGRVGNQLEYPLARQVALDLGKAVGDGDPA